MAQDDARPQIPPFFRYTTAEPSLTEDYIAEHYLDSYPLGFKGLYVGWSQFADPRLLGKLVHPVLQLLTVFLLGMAAFRIRRWPAVFVVCALAMSGEAFYTPISGGLARAFAPPIIALGVAGMIRGSRAWMIAGVLLGALFYPVAGVICGMLLALFLFFETPGFLHANWPERLRRAGLVAGSALLGTLLLIPVFLALKPYGEALTFDDAPQYPEIGPFGAGRGITNTYIGLRNLRHVTQGVFIGFGEPINPWFRTLMTTDFPGTSFPVMALPILFLLLLAGIGCLLNLRRGDEMTLRVCLMPCATVAGISLALLFLPNFYLPNRYMMLTPHFLLLFFAAGLSGMETFAREHTHPRGLPQRTLLRFSRHLLLISGVFLLVTLGSFGQTISHFNLETPKHHPGLFVFLESREPDSRVAGWPTVWGEQQSPIESVAYFSRQPVLMSYETHVVFQKEYLNEFRRRFHALANSYLAPNPEGLRTLAETYRVRYLLVDLPKLADPSAKNFAYIEPMQRVTDQLLQNLKTTGQQPALARLMEAHPQAVVYREGDHAVVDLPRLLQLAGQTPAAMPSGPGTPPRIMAGDTPAALPPSG